MYGSLSKVEVFLNPIASENPKLYGLNPLHSDRPKLELVWS